MSIPLAFRRALRSLARYPGVTILAVIALALGIGLPTAMYSVVDASILRGLPVADADRLMHLERRKIGTRGEGNGAAARDFLTWKRQQKSFEKLGAYRTTTVTLRVQQSVDRWEAGLLTPEVFSMLGTRPVAGRVFTADDMANGLQQPVVLADHVWRDRFQRDPNVVGTTVLVDDVAHTVLGIMPPDFRFPVTADVWLPLDIPASAVSDENFPTVDVLGKLSVNVSRNSALAEFSVIALRMAQAYPITNRNLEVTVKPYTERYLGEVATASMYVMMAAVLLVLVIACANVANLLLVRAIHRARDVAISMALGATRQRIIVQILVESSLIALIGGVLGLGVAWWGTDLLSRMLVGRMPYWANPRVDLSVLLFALMLAVTAAILAGIVPALKTTASDSSGTLRDNSRGTTDTRANRMMQGLVVVELAVSMGLLVATALLGLSVRNSSNVNMGFETSALFTAQLSVPDSYTPASRAQFFNAVEQRLQAAQGVTSVGLVSDMPGTHAAFRRVALEGVAYQSVDEMPAARFAAASPRFFPMLHVQPLRGRPFGTQDDAASELVALVNARFAQRFFPNDDPIGKRIRVGGAPDAPWRTIVGVVPDLWMGAFDAAPDKNPAGLYVPLAQSPVQTVSLAVQTKGRAPLSIADEVRQAVFAVDRSVPIYAVQDIPQLIASGTWFYGMGAGILGVCGVAALVLAFVGVYGVIAFGVGRRRREFGVRMALGATSSSIIRLVLRRGVLQIALGLSFGIVLALALARGVASLLFQVSPGNLVVFGGVAIALGAVAVAAMLIPALSASRTQPSEALRAE
ncbi:MAG: ABC transporter permease [Gemmatimonadota bacterium]|nr:ABC transporter permease [Gemmatimonadota bacterium]